MEEKEDGEVPKAELVECFGKGGGAVLQEKKDVAERRVKYRKEREVFWRSRRTCFFDGLSDGLWGLKYYNL